MLKTEGLHHARPLFGLPVVNVDVGIGVDIVGLEGEAVRSSDGALVGPGVNS